MGFSFGEPTAPLTPPLSPEFARRAPVMPRLQGRSAQALREADSDEDGDEDEEDIAMREYHGRRAPRPKESLLDLLKSDPPGWAESAPMPALLDAPPSPSASTAPSARSSKSARFLQSSLRGLKSRGSSKTQWVSDPLRSSKSSLDLRGGKAAKPASLTSLDFAHDLPPLPPAPAPRLATKDPVRARGSSTAELANFLRSSGPPQPPVLMAPVQEFGRVPTASGSGSANPRRRSRTLNGLGIRERSYSGSTQSTVVDNYYSTANHEAPLEYNRSGDSSDGFEVIAGPSRGSSQQHSPLMDRAEAALHHGESTGGIPWHTATLPSMIERRDNTGQAHSPVSSPRFARGHGSVPVPVLARQGSVASVSSHHTLSGGALTPGSPSSIKRVSRKPPPSPSEAELNTSQFPPSSSNDRAVISASTMAALQQLHPPRLACSTPVIAEEPCFDTLVAIPRLPRIISTPGAASRAPSPAFASSAHRAAQSSVDLATDLLAAQFTRPASIYLNNLPIPSDALRRSVQLDEAERALLRARPSSPPPDEPLPAPPASPSAIPTTARPPRESSLPRHASLSAESARLLATNGPTSKADKRKSTMRLSSYSAAGLTLSSPAPSVDSFVALPRAEAPGAPDVARPPALLAALEALQAAMKETAGVGLGNEADSVAAILPILRGLQSQFTLAAGLVGEVIAAATLETSCSSSTPRLLQADAAFAAEAGEATVVEALLGGNSPTRDQTELAYGGVSELSDHDSSSSDEEDNEDVETDVSIERAEVVVRTPTTPSIRRADSLA